MWISFRRGSFGIQEEEVDTDSKRHAQTIFIRDYVVTHTVYISVCLHELRVKSYSLLLVRRWLFSYLSKTTRAKETSPWVPLMVF